MPSAEKIVALLKNRPLKLATAESCTGGLLSSLITDVSGASAVFDCGIVSYSNEIKSKLLGVSGADLERHGAVSEVVARAMAQGVRALASADIGVGVTGIAGPLSDGTSKPVGLIYIAVADSQNCIVKEFKTDFLDDIRARNRRFAAENALAMLEEFLVD